MSLIQVMECKKCGNQVSWPYDGANPVDPWDKWSDGCPKCGGKTVDVMVILDKSGKIQNVTILNPTKEGKK